MNSQTLNPFDPRRAVLCSRTNANRVAQQMADASGHNILVERTGNPIQPFRVVPAEATITGFIETAYVCS